jgi:hypothetical protein
MIPLIVNNNTTVNNTINAKFNLNIFLNNDCKHAINFSEFIDNLCITDEDLEFSCDNGFINGICNIFTRGLKGLTQTTRPLHCSDSKRDIIYIKDNDIWDKDINNERLLKFLEELSDKQYFYVQDTWFNKNKKYIMSNDDFKIKHCHYLVAAGNSPLDNKYKQGIINSIEKYILIPKYSIV